MRNDIEDQICLSIPVGIDEVQNRWWKLEQPPPSVAFSLRGHLLAALGPNTINAIQRWLEASEKNLQDTYEDPPQVIEDFKSNILTTNETIAASIFRKTRMGQCLVAEGENLGEATTRLMAVLSAISKTFDLQLNAPTLVGESERHADNVAIHRWPKPSLLHRLLLSSKINFGGTGKTPVYPSGRDVPGGNDPGGPLCKAVAAGSISGFINALDDILVSADELAMLSAWAVVHLFRPF